MNEEEKAQLASDESLYAFQIDKYNLPSLLIKVLKSMRRNEVCEFEVRDTVKHIAKLRSNFANDYFD